MACAFCYYGLVLMSTELFGTDKDTVNIEAGVKDCHPLATTDYMDLLWTTLAEFPGIFTTIYIIEMFGRKKTMAFQFLVYAVCVTMLTATEKYEIKIGFMFCIGIIIISNFLLFSVALF